MDTWINIFLQVIIDVTENWSCGWSYDSDMFHLSSADISLILRSPCQGLQPNSM